MTSWYHFDCFFERQRPKSVGDIDHFDQLRWEDQEKIKTRMESELSSVFLCESLFLIFLFRLEMLAASLPRRKAGGKARLGLQSREHLSLLTTRLNMLNLLGQAAKVARTRLPR